MRVKTLGGLRRAEGAGLRALRETLLTLDEARPRATFSPPVDPPPGKRRRRRLTFERRSK